MHSLLQAVINIAARGEEVDGHAHVFVQRRCSSWMSKTACRMSS